VPVTLPLHRPTGRVLLTLLGLAGALFAAAVALLVLALAGIGPAWFDQAGAVTVLTTYSALLALRTGGRPVVFGGLALVIGVGTVLLDHDQLRGGTAVLAATVTAVLAIMATVPARRVRHALREVLVAVALAAVGALAVVGLRPVVALDRYDYVSLVFSFGLVFALVFRLGAGWHGLGRRGLVVVLVGTVALALSITYAELLRRYGSAAFIDAIFEGLRWLHDTAGAIPRPLQVMVGFPALMWGTWMRARRRQGWWVCAFGVAGTVSVAGGLMNPAASLLESVLVVCYSLVLGVVVGYLVIRADLLLTGPRGRRARQAEELTALRPEPQRFEPLL
jgi:hypothetical protein